MMKRRAQAIGLPDEICPFSMISYRLSPLLWARYDGFGFERRIKISGRVGKATSASVPDGLSGVAVRRRNRA
jgi:hypothetical protein